MSWTWDPVDPSKEEPQDDPWWDRWAQALLAFFFPLGGQRMSTDGEPAQGSPHVVAQEFDSPSPPRPGAHS